MKTKNLTGHLEDRLGQSLDVSSGDTSDRNTSVLGGVDRVFLGQNVHLLGLQASVGEHANLFETR
jgi:hypothetical protein